MHSLSRSRSLLFGGLLDGYTSWCTWSQRRTHTHVSLGYPRATWTLDVRSTGYVQYVPEGEFLNIVFVLPPEQKGTKSTVCEIPRRAIVNVVVSMLFFVLKKCCVVGDLQCSSSLWTERWGTSPKLFCDGRENSLASIYRISSLTIPKSVETRQKAAKQWLRQNRLAKSAWLHQEERRNNYSWTNFCQVREEERYTSSLSTLNSDKVSHINCSPSYFLTNRNLSHDRPMWHVNCLLVIIRR